MKTGRSVYKESSFLTWPRPVHVDPTDPPLGVAELIKQSGPQLNTVNSCGGHLVFAECLLGAVSSFIFSFAVQAPVTPFIGRQC